jgi:8-oxo-dGDP phosphatase
MTDRPNTESDPGVRRPSVAGERIGRRRPGEWITHSTVRDVYSSWWMTLRIDDVEKPDGSHTDHEVVIGPDAAGLVVLHPNRGVLMMWRHRFMPDTWGWEIPGGAMEPGEDPGATAARECLEETGWRPVGELRHLSTHHPSVGLVKQTFHVFMASDAVHEGDPSDRNEAAEVEWRTLEDVARDIRSGAISDAFSQLGIVLALAAVGRGHLLFGAPRGA